VHLRLLQHLLQKGSYASRRPHGHSDLAEIIFEFSFLRHAPLMM